ncbi:putative protein kinase [Leptomonas pyrrhocoris]|uniref:Protein kinase domain-containing protein n=1 Tax=Leptomonas pyrrhocoris TaxID=157538 RepID=A0A0M9G2L9_LEPPY|nr:putative protein kinase [Leptomonas pyrrhocoris]KPA80973.1 putative protein kinase [Leptomonas pyrrhocoris]|eukprot:XP_015659412.1 putative protein kinase [Leptomonas pyrrhocoris]
MNTSPTATHSLPDAAQQGEKSYFECPKCHRQCKSRTWFLKHLETCFKGSTQAITNGSTNSPVPASGEANAATPPASQQQQQHYHHHHRLPRGTGADDAVSSPVYESIGSSSPTSSVHSYQEGQSRRNSRLKFGGEGRSGSNDMPLDLSDSGVSPNSGASRTSALAFGFKHSYADPNQTGSMAKSPHCNADDASSRAFQAYYSNNTLPNNNASNGGGSVPPRLSHRTSMSQGISSFVGSLLGLRAGTGSGESGSAAFSNQRPVVAPPAAAAVTSGYQGVSFAEEVAPQQAPARQGSFRLHSDGTWTQYTPTASSSSSSCDDGDDAGMNGGDSFLAHSSRQSSQSLSRNGTNHRGPQHRSSKSCTSRPPNSRDPRSSSLFAGSRLISPVGPDTLSEPRVYERNGSAGSNRNESGPGAERHPSLSFAATSSLPREQERLVPRLMMCGNVGDQTPFERKGSGGGVDGNVNGDRLSRSQHGSASPGSLSCVSSSASPLFAQAMASPSSRNVSTFPQPGTSSGRISGVNGGGGCPSGVRTPRQSERSGAVTPRPISFQRGRAVGSGGFGTVYQAILSDGSLAAVKELKLENTNLKAIDREVRAMSSIPPHPNCVRYLGSRYSAHHYYLIMEYISGGSINALRKSVGRFRESVFQRYAYMVLLGLSHLHAHGIVHRDIKGANVLLDESGCAKIVDFGCSRDLNQATTTLTGGGTPLWMAPEVCRGEPATEKSDVWAFGCLCLEMTNDTGLPWSFPANITLQGVVYALACAKTSPPIPTDLSPEAQDFLQRCLKIDADERATVAELLQHPFFDVDLMEDSDEDEMLSSCPQSAVKRAVQQVQRSHIQDVRVADSDDGDDDEVRAGPLVLGQALGARSPRTNQPQKSSGLSGNVGDLIITSQLTHSKSPSGPRLDHYPRSVNVGFSLQAVDDEDDEDAAAGSNTEGSGQPQLFQSARAEAAATAPEEPSAFGPDSDVNEDVDDTPLLPSTSVPASRMPMPPKGSAAGPDIENEDEDEYTQMIAEIITEAREAYTDEERRMTEQRRRRNDLYPSSDDDDDGSFSDSSLDTSAGRAAVSRERHPRALSPSGASGEITSGSDADGDDDGRSADGGGPQKHKLGDTWRAAHTSPSPIVSLPQAHPRGGREDAKVEGKRGSLLSAQTPPNIQTDQNSIGQPGATDRGATSSRYDTTPPKTSAADTRTPLSLLAQTHADPQGVFPVSSSNPLTRSSAAGGSQPLQQQSLLFPSTTTTSSLGSHRPSPRHPTPTSLAQQSSVFREAAPRETMRETHLSMSAVTPPKGVAATSNGTLQSPREPGGPGRSSASAQPHHVRLSPSFLPLPTAAATLPPPAVNATASTDAGRNSGSVDGQRSPRTSQSQSTPALAVGGPSRPSSQGSTALVAFPRHSPNRAPVEWYTGGAGRLERNVTWQTGGSAEQPKELSMAQKEMQEMLDWGRDSDHHSSTVSSSSPGTLKHSFKDSSSDNAGGSHDAQRHRRKHRSAEKDSESPAAKDPVKSLSSSEKVDGKRRHLGLGLFRSRKSK